MGLLPLNDCCAPVCAAAEVGTGTAAVGGRAAAYVPPAVCLHNHAVGGGFLGGRRFLQLR